jgi:hypothetical protein
MQSTCISKEASKNNSSQTERLITLREAVKEDEGFIYSTWLKGLYYGNEYMREVPEDLFGFRYRRIIETILLKSAVVMAVLTEDTDVIIGYSVIEPRDGKMVLHWCHVKPAWRKLGIAHRLVPDEVTITTHLTKVGKAIKPKRITFDPFI